MGLTDAEPITFTVINGRLIRTGEWPPIARFSTELLHMADRRYVGFSQCDTVVTIKAHNGPASYMFVDVEEPALLFPVLRAERIG